MADPSRAVIPKRTGGVMLPDELDSPEKSLAFQTQKKEQAKPAKA